MIRKLAWLAIAGVAAFGAPQNETAAATASLPKAETILDRFVEATGGKAAYDKRTGEISTGTFEMAAQGIKGSLTVYSAAPDKSYRVIELDGIGKVESGTGNGIAWEKNPMLGPRVMSGEEKAQNLREAAFNGAVNWRSLYVKAETTGVETIDGEECYKVVLTPAEGKPLTSYFQKKSGLAVKQSMVAASAMGEAPVDVAVSDYKSFGGILTPTKMVQKVAGQEFTISIDKVQVNPEIPPDRFAIPAEVRALLQKNSQGKSTKQ